MSQRCDVCGKGPLYGHAVSHSNHATNRRFMPNINRRSLVVEGKKQKLNICSKCLRTLNKTS
jgi:large subunit ribosomal protein L28